ncbi:FAD-binding-2 domain-containing protein [Fusarium keratoplasticum]|uniref:FAD-binding-2 domain-containing protein n=1 Tax=Fusarium keratoplasticum TaxID=1328300 RepID=A0ACC0QAT1_9HYPO|nr:FAD-binding-2 domain-containing protein [Fusarium keratoplasticum]KAI8648564.1 FAD-binding-2 domain-containing protein [Fusarium keratoplasticum]
MASLQAKQKPDVIVVGSGIAGLSASIAAAEKGASVLLLERFHGGGTTALSGGIVYAGGGTQQQKEAGYDDTPENMFAYLRQEIGDVVQEKTLKRFCDESPGMIQWLEKHGARFKGALSPYKTSYPNTQHYLYFSGSEKAYPYSSLAKPAPRGHRMVHDGFSGAGIAKALLDGARRLGVQIVPASKVEKILLAKDGSVRGVEYLTLANSASKLAKHEKLTNRALKYQITLPPIAGWLHNRASKIFERNAQFAAAEAPAVILAAGGFSYSPEMRRKYLPDFQGVTPLGTPADDGSGIMLGVAVGGSTSHMGWERVGAEDVYGALLTEKMMRNHQSQGFAIYDSTQWAKARKQLPTQKARSLEKLAKKLGISPQGLRQTVDAYNDAIKNDKPDPANKMPDTRSPILKPPFYGIDISIKLTKGLQQVIGLSLGGLRVEEESGLVLNEAGKPIKGLCAAGRNAVGICSSTYVSGLSLGDGVFSGRRAGVHAAGNVKTT